MMRQPNHSELSIEVMAPGECLVALNRRVWIENGWFRIVRFESCDSTVVLRIDSRNSDGDSESIFCGFYFVVGSQGKEGSLKGSQKMFWGCFQKVLIRLRAVLRRCLVADSQGKEGSQGGCQKMFWGGFQKVITRPKQAHLQSTTP